MVKVGFNDQMNVIDHDFSGNELETVLFLAGSDCLDEIQFWIFTEQEIPFSMASGVDMVCHSLSDVA
jgi:hypothetical protein